MERETRFELATSTLARLHSTTELFPRALSRSDFLAESLAAVNRFFQGKRLFREHIVVVGEDIGAGDDADQFTLLENRQIADIVFNHQPGGGGG